MNYVVTKRASGPPVKFDLADRREHPRRKTRFKAMIVFNADESPSPRVASCVVKDLSEAGARLKLNSPDQVGTQFHLIWVAECAVLAVEAVWRGQGEIGVKFLSKHDMQGRLNAELAAVCRAWERHAQAKV